MGLIFFIACISLIGCSQPKKPYKVKTESPLAMMQRTLAQSSGYRLHFIPMEDFKVELNGDTVYWNKTCLKNMISSLLSLENK